MELEGENASLRSRIRSLEDNKESLENELERTQSEVEGLTELSDGLRALVNELRSQLSGVQLTNEDLEKEVTELNVALEKAGADISEMRSELSQLRAENEDLAVTNEELAAMVVELKTHIEDKNDEVDRLHSENAELDEVNRRLTDRSEKTEAEFVRLSTAHEQLVVAHEAVLKQLSDTQDAVEALDTARRHLLSFLTDIFGTDDCITQNDGRFSFCSTVMFEVGSDVLSAEGRRAIGAVASQMAEIDAIIERQTSSLSCPDGIAEAGCIEAKIDWILRIDGHTDNLRIHPHSTRFQDNWDLSTARAQAVVRYMIEEHGVSPTRLAATGFGEFHPIASNETEEGRARNRRIDITLSHR
jgi:chemotaxis protein MotB